MCNTLGIIAQSLSNRTTRYFCSINSINLNTSILVSNSRPVGPKVDNDSSIYCRRIKKHDRAATKTATTGAARRNNRPYRELPENGVKPCLINDMGLSWRLWVQLWQARFFIARNCH